MAMHFLAAGKTLPPLLMQVLKFLNRSCNRRDIPLGELPDYPAKPPDEAAPPNFARLLTQIHAHLTCIVAPARPGDLLSFAREAAEGGGSSI